MTAQITRTSSRCELITIHSKRSFADLISRIEATFQCYDPKTLRDLTAEGDTKKLAAYVKQVGEPTEFAIFFSLDQGSTQRLAGIPIESRFYVTSIQADVVSQLADLDRLFSQIKKKKVASTSFSPTLESPDMAGWGKLPKNLRFDL
jgi:hypothetical protein